MHATWVINKIIIVLQSLVIFYFNKYMKFCEGAGGDDYAPWRDEMEPDARANRDIREAVQRRNAHPEFPTNRTNHLTASQVRQD